MTHKSNHSKYWGVAVILLILAILIDQGTKYLAVTHLKDQAPFIIWKNVFQLRYLENNGAAFGILQNKQWFFVLGALIITAFVCYFYHKLPFTRRYLPLRVCMVLLVSGALGNVIDRVMHRYVVDFFYFEWIDFPIFNVADIYVVISCILFLLLIFFYYKEEDFAFLTEQEQKNDNT